jgi:hypothetical protein
VAIKKFYEFFQALIESGYMFFEALDISDGEVDVLWELRDAKLMCRTGPSHTSSIDMHDPSSMAEAVKIFTSCNEYLECCECRLGV